MKLTNECGLPDAIVRAVENDPYTKGDADYSVTQLLKPPRMVALERYFYDDLTEDASDRIWSLFGQVVHGILERAETAALAEKRWYATVSGKRISGGMDRFVVADGLLQDYKVTTVWKFRDGVPLEFEQQLNVYAFLLRENGMSCTRAEIVAILRDWSKPQAKRDISYPRKPVIRLEVPMWGNQRCRDYLAERIALHEAAPILLPMCTPPERWATKDLYAVTKEGAARATSLHDDMIEAEVKAAALTVGGKSTYNVVKRIGENKRCDNYCSVSAHCSQYKELCDQSRK